jgi:very-short-patch-repair endonuclease
MRRVQQRQQRSTAPTRPELALYAILNALPVVYERQFTIDRLMTVDACVPSSRLVIQADGDYWHGRRGATERRVANRVRLDRSQDAYLLNHGWSVIRLWGSDLLKRPDECRDTLLRHLRLPHEAAA